MSLLAASRSELTKQFTTAGWWILAIVLVVYVGSSAGGLAGFFSALATGALTDEAQTGSIDDASLARLVYSLAASLGYVFPLLVGTLAATAEFRYETLTPTFLATPRRGVALTAKALVGIVMGLLFAVVAVVSVVLPGAALIASFGLDPALGSGDTWALLGRAVLALVIWALVGIGLGTLVRNQVVAIVVVLAFTQFVEPILRLAGGFVDVLSAVTNFLPGAASDALVGMSIFNSMGQGGPASADPLEWWAGGLVLGGYTLVFLVLGYLLSWRRDVT
ncbi:MAG: ABC transporter permease [Microbacterium sp.]|uniref:ABC transporter permease n=1 Tax=Microbacterium sp. TaxID=51671 RepID=UPI0039E4A313